MKGALRQHLDRWRWTAKRTAFSLLRLRQAVRLYEGEQKGSGLALRVLHVGDDQRGRFFVEHLYGHLPPARILGHALVTPSPRSLRVRGVECDLELIEINPLYSSRYRGAGYFVIPEWVLFGRPVVADPRHRYADAPQSLRRAVRAARESDFELAISQEPADFTQFYETMYRPHTVKRFGATTILKSRRHLQREFRSGFLMQLKRAGSPVAAGIARVSGTQVSLTAIGVLDGSEEILRSNASAALDYHLHEYAAAHGMLRIDVGHTRPFPGDGVFFNKRKWQMRIAPDADGAMSMALGWRGRDPRLAEVLERYSFVYEGAQGLGVFGVRRADHPLDFDEVYKWRRLCWVEGLSSFIAVCPRGVRDGVVERLRAQCGPRHFICPDLKAAREIARGEDSSRACQRRFPTAEEAA
jgi:hypothetical protein